MIDSNFRQQDHTPRAHDSYNPWNVSQVQSGQLAVHFYRLGNNVVLGHEQNGTKRQAFLEAHNRNNGFRFVGYPANDGSGLYVHTWEPYTNVKVQNVKNAQNEKGALVAYQHDSTWVAFCVRGAFWTVWSGCGGPAMTWNSHEVGLPTSDETTYTEGSNTYIRQDFQEVSFLYLNGVTTQRLKSSLPSLTEATYHIAIVPPSEPTPNLTVSATALSPTSIQVTGNQIGQATTEVYLDGSYVGQLTDSQFVITGLQDQTSYQIKLVALGPLGQTLKQSETVTVTTTAFPSTTAPVTLTQASIS